MRNNFPLLKSTDSVDYSGNVQFPYVILQHYKFNIRVKWPELSDL